MKVEVVKGGVGDINLMVDGESVKILIGASGEKTRECGLSACDAVQMYRMMHEEIHTQMSVGDSMYASYDDASESWRIVIGNLTAVLGKKDCVAMAMALEVAIASLVLKKGE